MDTRLERSQDANVLLHSDAFKRAYARAKERTIAAWAIETNPLERESLWHMLRALELIQSSLIAEASEAIQEEVKAKALQPR